MKITVIGTGYVGLVTGACLSDVGIEVTCVDIDQKKIDGLKNGILPIYEPGLKEIVERNYAKGRLNFSTELSEAILDWEPKVMRDKGLKRTYEWFKSLPDERLNRNEHRDFKSYIK